AIYRHLSPCGSRVRSEARAHQAEHGKREEDQGMLDVLSGGVIGDQEMRGARDKVIDPNGEADQRHQSADQVGRLHRVTAPFHSTTQSRVPTKASEAFTSIPLYGITRPVIP